MMADCPCTNCPCVAICRLKKYAQLINCKLLENYIGEYIIPITCDDALWRIEMFNALQPTTWNTNMKTGLFVRLNCEES